MKRQSIPIQYGLAYVSHSSNRTNRYSQLATCYHYNYSVTIITIYIYIYIYSYILAQKHCAIGY